jgi:hypothetical protein
VVLGSGQLRTSDCEEDDIVTPNLRHHIDEYLDDLIESDRAAKPEALIDLLQDVFALTPDEARHEYNRWLEDVA